MTAAALRRALLVAATAVLLAAPTAHGFDITSFGAGLTDPGTAAAPATTNLLTAGSHPDVTVALKFPVKADDNGQPVPDGSVKTVDAQLPRGLIVNPTVAATCTQQQLSADFAAACPVDSQVGVVYINFADSPDVDQEFPLYNMAAPPGVPAQFAFNVYKVVVQLDGVVRTGGDYGLSAAVRQISQGLPVVGTRVVLWGTPADAVHDPSRYRFSDGFAAPPAASGLAPRAFTSNPGACTGEPVRFGASAASWQAPDAVVSSTATTEPDGAPLTLTDCATLPFEPTVSVQPTTTAPDSPTGLDVRIEVAQSDRPEVRSSAHLKDLKLTLPEGMTVNPAGADGLAACAPAQIALASASAPACPDAATLGSVRLTTPLLPEPLTGRVYLAAQNDNPFGSLLALYLVAQGQGVTIKLPGRIDADPATGRLVVTFADAPQLPFSRLDVSLDGGPRAPLATPPSCGPQTVTAELTPWSGGATRTRTDGFTIDCAPGLGAFAPAFEAGTVSPTAGLFSPLALRIDRPDGQQVLRDLSLTLPPGLLARLTGVPLCADAQAAAGTCDGASRVGSATVSAGAGSKPFPLVGDVFLTGPYKGAPYGLAVRVRVLAGPLDLGTVVVRQTLTIDSEDTHVSVVSDPLPTILSGIPIRLRTLDVVLDRPGFTVNPTRCSAKTLSGVLGSAGGARAAVASRFQVAGCAALALRPKLALALTGGRKALHKDAHPGVTARLTQGPGQSNLRRVEVKLPLSLALDPDNAEALCEAAVGAARDPQCPQSSVVGSATVTTSLLPRPLSGPVYFVKGVRRSKSGKLVRTLPKLVLPLRGNGLQITLRANTTVRDQRLVTQFDGIPDAAVTRFDLKLAGGRNGILVAVRDVCRSSRRTGVRFRGQTARLETVTRLLGATCAGRQRRSTVR